MICSILMVTQCLEGLFYDYLEKRYQEKDKQYEIMRCRKILDFYNVLHYNFPYISEKPFSLKTVIMVVDHVNKKTKTLTIRPENLKVIQKLNTQDEIKKYLRNIYTSLIMNDI